MNITTLLSQILKLRSSVDTIQQRGVMPYRNLSKYPKDSVVSFRGRLYQANKDVPLGVSPLELSYWKPYALLQDVTDQVSITNVSESDSEIVFTLSDGSVSTVSKVVPEVVIEAPEPIHGDKGDDGVGIVGITHQDGIVQIGLTNGSVYSFPLPVADPLSPHTIDSIEWDGEAFVVILSDKTAFSIPVELPVPKDATITIGDVETISSLESAVVENVGTDTDAIFNFKIPQGKHGVSVVAIEQLSDDSIVIHLSDLSEYQVTLPRGSDGVDADNEYIINKLLEKLSEEAINVDDRISQQSLIIREELQDYSDDLVNNARNQLYSDINSKVGSIINWTLDDILRVVNSVFDDYKRDIEQERQQGFAQLDAFLAKY